MVSLPSYLDLWQIGSVYNRILPSFHLVLERPPRFFQGACVFSLQISLALDKCFWLASCTNIQTISGVISAS